MDFDDEDVWGRPGFIPWAAGLAVMLLSSVVAYLLLPADAEIPLQINPGGSPINFESKGWALFLLPAIVAMTALVMDVVPFMPRPKKEISMAGKYLFIGVMLPVHLIGIWMAFKWHSP